MLLVERLGGNSAGHDRDERFSASALAHQLLQQVITYGRLNNPRLTLSFRANAFPTRMAQKYGASAIECC